MLEKALLRVLIRCWGVWSCMANPSQQLSLRCYFSEHSCAKGEEFFAIGVYQDGSPSLVMELLTSNLSAHGDLACLEPTAFE